MAEAKIPFAIAYKQNDNAFSHAYGKYYAEAYCGKTLSLRGLIDRVAFDQSVYSRDIIEGVIQRLTKVMVELLQSAQPVKWDGLGTFTPKCESAGITQQDLLAGTVNVTDTVKGIHIRFIPENSKGEELTAPKFKDTCILDVAGVIQLTKVTDPVTGKVKKRLQTLVPMDTWRSNQQNGGGDNGGGGD